MFVFLGGEKRKAAGAGPVPAAGPGAVLLNLVNSMGREHQERPLHEDRDRTRTPVRSEHRQNVNTI